MFDPQAYPPALETLDSDDLLAAMAELQRGINTLTALQLAYAAEFAHRRPAPELPTEPGGERARWDGVSEFADAEIGCALTISRSAAGRLLGTALDLERLPETAAALAAGDLDLARARLIADETAHLDDPAAAAVEARVLERAPQQVYSALRRALRRAAHALAPAAEAQRQADVAADRRTEICHGGDGRSQFTAEGPTHDIFRIAAAVDAVARTFDHDERTLDQRRFDALTGMADTILDDPALPATRFGPPGIVLLADTGALARLTGEQSADAAGNRPVELAGDGPIPDSLAIELLDAEHTTVVAFDTNIRWTCDHTGGYEVPDRLAQHLTGHHPRCVFPGCAMPAHRCDWDHVIPWPDGPTCACNLVPLCRHHHRLKTHTRWRLTLHPDRLVEWTSPTGRTYTVSPDNDVGETQAA